MKWFILVGFALVAAQMVESRVITLQREIVVKHAGRPANESAFDVCEAAKVEVEDQKNRTVGLLELQRKMVMSYNNSLIAISRAEEELKKWKESIEDSLHRAFEQEQVYLSFDDKMAEFISLNESDYAVDYCEKKQTEISSDAIHHGFSALGSAFAMLPKTLVDSFRKKRIIDTLTSINVVPKLEEDKEKEGITEAEIVEPTNNSTTTTTTQQPTSTARLEKKPKSEMLDSTEDLGQLLDTTDF